MQTLEKWFPQIRLHFFIQEKSAQFLLIKIRTTLNSKKRRRLTMNIQANAEGYTQISQSK